MIIKIDSDLFFSEDKAILESLTNIVLEIINNFDHKKFLWEIDEVEDFSELIKDTIWYKEYLSNTKQELLEETLVKIQRESTHISELQKNYLTTILIGVGKGKTLPKEAEKLVHERAKVILENATNDWKFITGIIQKYKKHKQRGNLYKRLYEAIDKKWIEPEHAGGKGDLPKRVNDLLNRYGAIYHLKLVAIFDSDKKSKAASIPNAQQKLIKFLKNIPETNSLEITTYEKTDKIIWHMLYKREMENYLPLEVLKKYLPDETNSLSKLREKNEDEYDFCDMEAIFVEQNKSIDVKNEFPKLFKKDSWTRNLLEDRCKHHPCSVEEPDKKPISEIEQILLKLIKII